MNVNKERQEKEFVLSLPEFCASDELMTYGALYETDQKSFVSVLIGQNERVWGESIGRLVVVLYVKYCRMTNQV